MSKNVKKNKLQEIEENPIKEGIIFKKRILSINKRDNNKSYIIKNNNFSLKNMKKNFSMKFSKQNIKNNESFNESLIPLNSLRKKALLYNKNINSPITDRSTYYSNEKFNSFNINNITSKTNSKFKYHKKLNIQSPKIILNLPENDIYNYNGHISPRIPKIIFQSSDIPRYTGQNQKIPKKISNKKYNKIIINSLFETNKNKENNMNINNIINNKKNNKKIVNEIPKNKMSLKKRNSFCNYSKQITHFALQKNKNSNNNNKYLSQYTQQQNYNDENILYELYSPRNNYNYNNNTNSDIKYNYKISNKNKELFTDGNIGINNNINNNEQYKTKRISKISLKHSINNKINKFNLENLDILQNSKDSLNNNFKQNKNKKLVTEEIKIKNSKLLDYMKKSKSNKKEPNLNSSINNLNFNIEGTYDKYSKRKRNLSFNIFNSFNPDSNPLLFSNDDSYINNNNINMTFLSNGTFFSNNNNSINEKRVIFNRKIDYKKNKFNGDYVELAKICANQEKIISDLVKNVQSLNNQICDKDLCINELNNQLYSIKYDLLNTLQKTNGKS